MTDLNAPTKLGLDDAELEAALERASGDTEHSTRAYKAMARAQQMRPGLQAFARALTREPNLTLKIWGGPTSCTDGEEILISPPMELGNDVRHTRTLCNDYDELGLSRCPGCRASERVLRSAEHEIGHITQGTFTKGEKRKLSWLLKRAAEWLEARAIAEGFKPVRDDGWDDDGNPIYRCRTAEEWRKEITNAIRRAPNPMMVYLNCAVAINPWLKVLWNGLEDGRVNNGIHRARPGSRRYFRGSYLEMLEQGILLPDGTWLQYSDREIESQLSMAVTFASMGYGFDITDHFAPEVIEILADPKIRDVIERAADAEGVADTFNLARDLLGHLQGHGYMADPPPPALPTLGDADEDDSDDSEASSERSAQHSDRSDSEPEQPRDSEREDCDEDTDRPEADRSPEKPEEPEEPDGEPDDETAPDGEPDPDDEDRGAPDRGEPAEPGPSPDSSDGAAADTDDADGDDEPGDGTAAEGDDDGEADDEPGDGSSAEANDGEPDSGDEGTDDGDGMGPDDSEGSEEESDSSSAGSPDADQPGSGAGESGEDDDADCAGDEPSDDEGSGAGSGSGLGATDGADSDDDLDDDEDEDEEVEPGPTAQDIEQAARRAQADLDIATGHPGGDEDYGDPMRGDWLGDDEFDPEMPDPEENTTSDEYSSEDTWGEGSDELEVAHTQHEFFRAPSREIGRVNLLKLDDLGRQDEAWRRDYVENTLQLWQHLNEGAPNPFRYREAFAGIKDRELMDAVVQRSLNQARMVFTENRAVRRQRNLPYGRLATGAGPKLKTGNVKVFGRRTQPDSKDYAVLIGLDISGSTGSGILVEMKQAAYAQAELLHRLGIEFAFYCHTSMTSLANRRTVDLDLVVIKSFAEQWNDETRGRLDAAMSSGGNIDGHTLQTYRKLVEREHASDRLILYYTDGAMPLENYDEELEILQYECKLIERTPNLNVLAVGAQTDSPKQHGLETVRLDSPDDLPTVVDALKRKLL